MKLAIVSGYFNPLHKGHLELFNRAKRYGDLYVIVNNDRQVKLKATKRDTITNYSFMSEGERLESVSSHARWYKIAEDEDETVAKTLESIVADCHTRKDSDMYGHDYTDIHFVNGGDAEPNPAEKVVCDFYNIKMIFGAGHKIESSSHLVENAYFDWLISKFGKEDDMFFPQEVLDAKYPEFLKDVKDGAVKIDGML